ncbi:PleD family two-component system response regulator [Anaerolineales bacterium HSG24]|nr:PleD family two-component system response regulator [Anaerolineales bacterium HSG24]
MNLKGSTVLIVDDKPENLDVLIIHLSKTFGFTILVAQDGYKAISLAHQFSPDIILLDIMMPGIDGYETCVHLKVNSATKDIPVIFMSALSETVNKVDGFEMGAVDYITKPVEYEEVFARVKTHLTLRYLQKYTEETNKQLQQEIVERKRLEKKLHDLASIDGLTKVANRRSFDEYLNQKWQEMKQNESPLSLIMCDIDYFKQYNDIYGHPIGDTCLYQIAQNIHQVVTTETSLVARYGGEEFAVILTNTSLEQAYKMAQLIQDRIARMQIAHEQSEISPYLTVSMGISSIVPNSHVPDKLIEIADKMLYQAKSQGRNRINYDVARFEVKDH